MGLEPLERKVALITGANKGIGLEIARQLGRQGVTVLVGARDAGRGREATERLRSEGIDAYLNAGIFIDDAPPSGLDREVLRRTYETNVFGPVAVTKAMLPPLRKSSAGRVVNMSSGLGSLTLASEPGWEFAGINLLAYNSSKSALNSVTVQFAKELRDTPIKVNAADPGYTATDLNNHQGTRDVEQGARAAVRLATLPADGPTGGFFDEDGPLPW